MSELDDLEDLADQMDHHHNVGTRSDARGAKRGHICGGLPTRQRGWRHALKAYRGWKDHQKREDIILGKGRVAT